MMIRFKKKKQIYHEEPWIFAREICLFEPDRWQMDVLQDIAKHANISVRLGQGVGKTGLESVVVL